MCAGNLEVDDAMKNGDASTTTEVSRPVNLLEQASFFSRMFFFWPYPLLKLGLKRPLEEEDLPDILKADSSNRNKNRFDQIWDEEKRQNPKEPSLHRAIIKDFLKSIWFVQPIMMLAMTAKIIQALALGLLIESFETGSRDGYKWAGVLVGTGLVILFQHHHIFFITWRKGMQYRISAVASIYAKSLRLSSTHQETNASTGKIMNLASNDVERFLLAALFVSYLFWSPVQSIAILVVGWMSLGPAFAAGFALLVFVFVPLQFFLSSRFAHFRSRIAAITDRRVTFVSQAVNGARVMKMSGYENRFLERIQEIRKEEVGQIANANRLKAWNEALFFGSNIVISLVIFLVHVFIGGALTPRDVFTVFTLINVLQLEMTKHVSLGVMGVSECYVSITRIQGFLDFPETPVKAFTSGDSSKMEQPISNNEKDDIAIRLSNVSCCWNEVQEVAAGNFALKETATPLVKALSNVSIDFRHGGLTCIIGTVGSGKSALMQALVGELQVHSGTLERRKGTLAYASQDPWIMNGTVKDNIVMGKDWDDEWYKEVVSACALLVDFQQLLNSDQTIVGDRGVQLSGGQRARVGLARAMYRDADVIVLDDPLSAVDSKVGRQLFNEAIQDLAISRGKCVVLATHQHQYVNEATCVLMAGGRIEKIGSYDECVAASKGKLTAHAADFSVDELPEVEPKEAKPVPVTVEEILGEKNGDSKKAGDDNKETKASGIVSIDTYIQYAKAMGGVWVAALLLLLYCITQASVLVTIATIGRWAERPEEEQDDWDILGLVIGLGCLVIFLSVFRAFVSFEITIKASRHLHDAMTQAVLRSKIEFFDTNPLGRILNRFSADVGSNDDLLPQTLLDFLVVLFIVLGAILTTFVVLPIALIALPPLVWYFLSVRKIFVTSTRELKRLEGLARSPIFAMLSEALSGIATIRANDSVKYFTEKFEAAHDGHTRAFFSFIACSRWAGFRMDSIMFALMSMVSFLSVLFQQEGWLSIDPAILGLSISMLLQLAGLFQWCIRQNAEVVNQFVSVERVLDFGSLESEASLELENDKNLGDWPERGEIDVKDLAVRYRPALPLALNGASFKIPSGARIGVVGRTGSGKSTVVQTLFRLLEAERGCISIDGVDISTVGLHTLRSKISVIPQAPTLFSGCTVRENLDLFGIHSEEAIQKALKDAHLAEAIAELPKGYDSMVSEGGTNFSVGQRQLLCLARAILSKSKILVLDEATASVDRRTDQLLHESLQESFGDATILAVAHRLDTVIDHDMILVLGQGKVLEYGTPADLIRSGGMFSKMIKDTGDTMSRDLRQRALAKENKDKTE